MGTDVFKSSYNFNKAPLKITRVLLEEILTHQIVIALSVCLSVYLYVHLSLPRDCVASLHLYDSVRGLHPSLYTG